MQILLSLYLLILLILGINSYKKIKNYKDFAIAGANQNTLNISLSLLAGMIGGSATFGVIALVSAKGFPAFWWLGSGAVFLILQAYFLAEPVRNLNAFSLPHLAKKVINKKASIYISMIICVTWIGIVAAQFIALEQLVFFIFPNLSPNLTIAMVACFVIIYTFLGGQYSIIKTDALQFTLLFLTVLAIFVLIYFTEYFDNLTVKSFAIKDFSEIYSDLSNRIEFFNDSFGLFDFFQIFFIVGLSYFVGPDIFSRNLSARNGQVAKKATYLAAIVLFLFSIIIVFSTLWVNENIVTKENSFIILIKDYLPSSLALLLTLGLISALISSADTCLMSTATIFVNDIWQNRKIVNLRIMIVIVGLIALGLAIYRNNIIGLLLTAYSVYVPGVVIPLGLAIYFHHKRTLNRNLLFIAIMLGSCLGLASSLFKVPYLSFVGLAVSGLFGMLACFGKWQCNEKVLHECKIP